ncbi:MAG: Gfo/Idh/MocA family oxidoreductase [Opitutaceae bacterium]|jgi:predicted dehydrogenase|nr:Gfo/Idh/MocA family oxidoreductase [Opitutaceae bacterium]
MSLKPLRIGLIGAGANTRLRHIPGFRALPGVELAAVANRSRESSGRAAAEFGIPRVAGDWREIIAAPGIDAVCIGAWPWLHAEASIAALRAGKHVLTEARMARDAGEAAAMLGALREARKTHPGIVAQIVPAPMTLAFDTTIRRLLDGGAIGALREITITHTNAAQSDASAPLTWRQDIEKSGHNIMTLGIHYEALLRWLDDDADVVAADGAVFTPARAGGDGRPHRVQIPESLTVLARFPRTGARLVIHLSGVETTRPRNEIRLNGSAGGLRLDLDGGTLHHERAGGGSQPVAIPAADRGEWRVERDFINSIREGAPARLTDFETGLRYMRFTDAVWEAWGNKKPQQ